MEKSQVSVTLGKWDFSNFLIISNRSHPLIPRKNSEWVDGYSKMLIIA